MIGTISGIMIMIVCVTVSTSRHIWRIFFTKLKVKPRDKEVSSFTTKMMGRAKNPHLNSENEQQRNEVLSVTDQLMSQTNTSQLNRDGLPNKVSGITEKWTSPAKALVVNRDNEVMRNKEFSDTTKEQNQLSSDRCTVITKNGALKYVALPKN